MNKIHSKTILAVITLVGAISASASSVIFSGADLNGLHYSGASGDAQYVPGTPDYAQLYTPDSSTSGDAPAVYVRANNPLATSSLSTLSFLNASYSLLSSSGGNGNQPYWLTYITDPTTSGLIGVVSFGGPDLNSSSLIHVFYDYDPGALTANTYWGDTLSQLDSTAYGTTTFGQLTVYETGVEIGNWAISNGTTPATADVGSITVSTDPIPVPEPTTIALAGLGGVSLLLFRRRKQ